MFQTIKKAFNPEPSPSVGKLGEIRIDADKKTKTIRAKLTRTEEDKIKIVFEATLGIEGKSLFVKECNALERKITPKEVEAIRKWLSQPSESYKGITNIQRVNQIFN